jgi:hypothetical protein
MKKSIIFSLVALSVFIVSIALGIAIAEDVPDDDELRVLWTDVIGYIFPNNAGPSFQITDTGNLSVPGSVGIGTTDPIGDIGLHLKTSQWAFTSAAGMVIQAATSNDDPGLMLFNSSDKEVGAFGGATNPGAWSIDAQSGDVTLRAANGRLIFSTENVAFPPYPSDPTYQARMMIDQSGNVGIGTTSPTVRFEIKGLNIGGIDHTMGLYPDGTGSSAGILFAQNKSDLDAVDTKHDVASIGIGTLQGHWGNDVQPGDLSIASRMGKDIHLVSRVARGSAPTQLIIKNNGNVGIGTTSPTEKLHVDGKVKATEFVTGDITFQKNNESLWRMYEDEEGLYLENLKTCKVYRFVLQEVKKE